LPKNLSPAQVEDYVVGRLSEPSVSLLVFIDNADSLDPVWLRGFMERWLRQCANSVMLLTMSTGLGLEDDSYFEYELRGLRDAGAVASLCGEELARRFPDVLAASANKLGNNPQRLLYLRWMNPETEAALAGLTERLSASNSLPVPLTEILSQRISRPVAHLLALGRVRALEVSEDLLSWLWDKLDGGSADCYISTRERLVREGVITREPESGRLQVNPDVHIQFERELIGILGSHHLAHIDYYLAEYFRRQYEASSIPAEQLRYLDEFVHYSILAGNAISALTFVARPEIVAAFHRAGNAFGLREVLSHIDEHVETCGDDFKLEPRIVDLWIQVKIEIAQCTKELGESERCLTLLDAAEQLVPRGTAGGRNRLLKRINYLRGIAYSSLGKTLECIRAYAAVATESVVTKDIDEVAVLALGYLAFETRFHDGWLARELAAASVALAEWYSVRVKDRLPVAKNLCNQAQILFFQGDIVEAERCFAEAEEAAASSRRELGRVQTYRSMIHLNRGATAEAETLLRQGLEFHRASGDRRRLASANALYALLSIRNGDLDRGWSLLEDALDCHCSVKDARNAILESLTYAYLRHGYDPERARDVARVTASCTERWASVLREAAETEFQVFAIYWRDYVQKQLLKTIPPVVGSTMADV
jgi:hypothetical protein